MQKWHSECARLYVCELSTRSLMSHDSTFDVALHESFTYYFYIKKRWFEREICMPLELDVKWLYIWQDSLMWHPSTRIIHILSFKWKKKFESEYISECLFSRRLVSHDSTFGLRRWCDITLHLTWFIHVREKTCNTLQHTATHCNKLPHYKNCLAQQLITMHHHSTSDLIHSCTWNGLSNGAITHTSTSRIRISTCDMTHLCPLHPSMSTCDTTHLCPHHPSMSTCDMTHLCPHHPSMSTCYMIHLWFGLLRSVGSIKSYVSLAEYRLFYRALLQKRPIVLSILLIEATP